MSKNKNKENYFNVIDISKLPDMPKVNVKVNDKDLELQIGDKLIYPADSDIIKTVVSISIFEDGTCNYLLKWFDGEFRQEMVSLMDLKLLNLNFLPRKEVSLPS